MKSDQIYQALCDLAEKLEIDVSEQNFRTSGIRVNSGLCQIKGKIVYIMDKHKSINRKVQLLAAELARHPHENIYVIPLVRDLLTKYKPEDVKMGPDQTAPDPDLPPDDSET